tara:strand:- start:341 stop:1120 length:780 start_codon:yes stop_codon:yes gene_type:complete
MNNYIFIHNLNPVAIEILNLRIYWYSLAYIFGFLFSLYYSKYLTKKKIINLNTTVMDEFITWAVVGVIIGGRIGYVLFYNFEFYIINKLEIIKIWQGGMSFHGGLIGLILSMIFFSKRKKIDGFELANLVTLCCPVGIFLGRIANFINGELVGRPTDQSWGVIFSTNDILRHPSQLYEAIFEGLIIFCIFQIIIKNKLQKKVNCFSIFLIVYAFARFLLEFFREPDNQLGLLLMDLSMGQILSIPMLLIGILFLKYGKS